MIRRKVVLVGIAVAEMIMAAGLVINYINSKEKYDTFEDHRELFEAVKDEIERLVSNQDDSGDNLDTSLYSRGMFHDVVSASVQGKIHQIALLSEDKLDILRYSKHDGKSLIRFVYNWERNYGVTTYHIVYCESRDVVVKAYERNPNGKPIKYILDELVNDWYWIEIR